MLWKIIENTKNNLTRKKFCVKMYIGAEIAYNKKRDTLDILVLSVHSILIVLHHFKVDLVFSFKLVLFKDYDSTKYNKSKC